MIDLFGMRSPNVQKVIVALEELEIPFRFHHIDVFMGDQFEEDFGRLTPNRKVPVIVDPDGPAGVPFTLWDSGAILIYLAEKTGRLMPRDSATRATMFQWLMFQMSGIGPMFGQDSHFQRYAPEAEHAYSRSRYRTEVLRLYDVVETRLAESAYLAGDEFTIADIAAWPWLRGLEARGARLETIPHVVGWVQRIAGRPGVRRALSLIDTLTIPEIDVFRKEHPDQLDKYLGRGAYAREQAVS